MEERDTTYNPGDSIANGTIDREAYPKHWYVARVQIKCEKRSAQRIASLGHETFVPVQEEIHQWSDRKKKIYRILIPLVVFVRTDKAGATQVERQSFVYDLLKAPGETMPAIIPDEQIDRFKFMIGNCDSDITIEPTPITAGDEVIVVRGSLKGLQGRAKTSSDGKSKIYISLDILGCASVEINPSDIEKV